MVPHTAFDLESQETGRRELPLRAEIGVELGGKDFRGPRVEGRFAENRAAIRVVEVEPNERKPKE